ncbi:hypothetical protein RRG08_035852 [Elysia crispata]|uniref:Uncharacterized protein n=1 Tax=Elysia crispata TaxID=231223 RepID=A0AAE1DAX1_9GAST|nr:hypothetical protein RRG08_035852 [Elysia crispata]
MSLSVHDSPRVRFSLNHAGSNSSASSFSHWLPSDGPDGRRDKTIWRPHKALQKARLIDRRLIGSSVCQHFSPIHSPLSSSSHIILYSSSLNDQANPLAPVFTNEIVIELELGLRVLRLDCSPISVRSLKRPSTTH